MPHTSLPLIRNGHSMCCGWLVIILSTIVSASGGSTARADQRRAEGETRAVEAAIADIEAGRKTTPLIGEPSAGGDATVTFVARRIGRRVPRIVSDVTGWGENIDATFNFTTGTMRRVARTDWYSLQARVAPRARIEYLIAYGLGDYRRDPHNPRASAGAQFEGAPASEFVTAGYVPPQEFVDPHVSPAGRTAETIIESQRLAVSRRVIVYTPPGYRDDRDYPLAVFLDLRVQHVARALDWLIANQQIEPLVAVFEGPRARGERGPTDTSLSPYLTDELLSWVASRYRVTPNASKRAIVGISFGAKDAVDAALSSPAAFGSLGLLIPGRRLSRAEIDAISRRRDRRLRVAILAGHYDHANVETARGLRRALADAGHAVEYTEVPEGHSAATWLNNLRVVLVSLFRP